MIMGLSWRQWGLMGVGSAIALLLWTFSWPLLAGLLFCVLLIWGGSMAQVKRQAQVGVAIATGLLSFLVSYSWVLHPSQPLTWGIVMAGLLQCYCLVTLLTIAIRPGQLRLF